MHHLLGRALADVDEATVQQLVDDRAPESRILEYRRTIKGEADPKWRFERTVSAFANTDGGIILFGIGEDVRGKVEIAGLSDFNFDMVVRQFATALQTKIDPPIISVVPRQIDRQEGGAPVLLYAVPRSLNGPHGVMDQSGNEQRRFYLRRTDGANVVMTTAELRSAFLEREAWQREAEHFRAQRVDFVGGYNYDRSKGLLLMHLLPLGRLRAKVALLGTTPPIGNHFGTASRSPRPNVDGVLMPMDGDYGYVRHIQGFRHGGVEVCLTLNAVPGSAGVPGEPLGTRVARGVPLSTRLADMIDKGLRWLQVVDIDPPYALYLTAIGVGGVHLLVSDELFGLHDGVFDRDTVLVPSVWVSDENIVDSHKVTCDALDFLWQSAGWPDVPKKVMDALPGTEHPTAASS